jgi:chromosome segregation ATPase
MATGSSRRRAPSQQRDLTVVEEDDFHIHFHIHKQDERIGLLMEKVDEVLEAFEDLNSAVREFISKQGTTVDGLQAELDQLKADDAVEDTKLEGLQSKISQLKSDVQSFSPPDPPEGSGDTSPTDSPPA